MENEKRIYVYADFLPFHNEFIGTIYGLSCLMKDGSCRLSMM